MDDWRTDRLASALNGTNPTVLARLESGFVVFCDTQFLPGYCILLAHPQNGLLNDLPMADRARFLADMTLVGDAITRVTNPLRINYAVMCNDLPLLHAHITPRYGWEPADRLRRPVQQYPGEYWTHPGQYAWDNPQYAATMAALKAELARLAAK